MRTLLVLGDAPCLFDDLRALGPIDAEWMAINRAGLRYLGRIHYWATYHQVQFVKWMWAEQRALSGGNTDYELFLIKAFTGLRATVVERPPVSGSSTFFGVWVGLTRLNYDRIVVCGAPLDDPAYHQYRSNWERMLPQLRGRVSSLSGWTRRLLGG